MLEYLSNIRALLRCTSCRFAAIYFVPFYAGLIQAGRKTVTLGLLGAVFCFVFSLSVEATNRLTDRIEDEVNHPDRTQLCARVGWQRLRSTELVGWLIVGVLDGLWLSINENIVLAVLLVTGFVIGISYSRGLRLARIRYIGIIVLNLVFADAFLQGWATSFSRSDDRSWQQLLAFVPLAIIIGVFVMGLAGIKDLTDRHGDLIAGYNSHFAEMVERQRTTALKVVSVVPFFLLLSFILLGWLSVRLLGLLVFAPFSMLMVEVLRYSHAPRELMVIRELFYTYWLVFSSVALLLFTPRVTLLCAFVGALFYWTIATRWFHWVQPIKRSDIKRLVYVATRHSKSGVSAVNRVT
jgi:4-hydroxybenzoate polyprenyltransferase